MRLYTFNELPKDSKTNILEIEDLRIVIDNKTVKIYSPSKSFDILIKANKIYVPKKIY